MKSFNDTFESLKKTIEEEIEFNKEIQAKIQTKQQDIASKEEQLELLANMKVQLQMSLKADREELKMLTEIAGRKQSENSYERMQKEQIERQQQAKYEQEIYELQKENFKLQEQLKKLASKKKWSV